MQKKRNQEREDKQPKCDRVKFVEKELASTVTMVERFVLPAELSSADLSSLAAIPLTLVSRTSLVKLR